MKTRINYRTERGFSILEVVIGIFVFVVGMLALGALQGSLTRTMSDAKLRTAAANLADSQIERQRGFTQLLTAVTPGVPFAYNDIATPGTDPTVTLDGVVYTIDMNVADYYYHLDTDTFTTVVNAGATSSDYKQVDVTVSWNADQSFRAFTGDSDDDFEAADLGSGSVTLTGVIPALITSASAGIAEESTNGAPAPPISYQPGQRPDVVSLALSGNKFKESLLPEPDVIRLDEFVETRFDVITYSGSGNAATFLRREEFAAVSCECTLRAADADHKGLRPVIWAGDEYKGGHSVAKPYGESATNQQSEICDSCCRDHHDGGTSSDDSSDFYTRVYGPFKSYTEYTGGFSGFLRADHKHYQTDGVTIAAVGDRYLEACRAVRVDGFFRIAQDFRREDENVFPDDFLDEEAEVDVYSDYATGAVTAYYGDTSNFYPSRSTPPCIGGPSPCVAEPNMQGASPAALGADEFPSWTTLPFNGNTTQQLRSRGIYIDYISRDLRTVLACLAGGGDASTCESGDVKLDKTGSTNALEMIPFFDVQLTKLNRWAETPSNVPVNSTNQALADNGNYSRGVISKSADGSSDVEAVSHRGNIGFTDTQAIDPVYNSLVTRAEINVQAGSGGPVDPDPSGDPIVGGNLTSSLNGNALATSDLSIVGSGNASCENTGANWSCEIPAGSTSPVLTVGNYFKNNKTRYICFAGLTGTLMGGTGGASTSTVFDLSSLAAGTTYTINIQAGACVP